MIISAQNGENRPVNKEVTFVGRGVGAAPPNPQAKKDTLFMMGALNENSYQKML